MGSPLRTSSAEEVGTGAHRAGLSGTQGPKARDDGQRCSKIKGRGTTPRPRACLHMGWCGTSPYAAVDARHYRVRNWPGGFDILRHACDGARLDSLRFVL
jgi:hypothetical protein